MADEKTYQNELEQRIEVVMTLLSRFMNRQQILQYASKKTDWDVSSRTIDDYISKAKEKLREKEDPEQIRGKIYRNFEMLFKKNLENEDFRECRNVLESIAKLTGANEPEEISTQIKISFED